MEAKTAYLSVDDAQIYFNGRLDTSAWDRASAENQLKALIQASSDIDRIQYIGFKSNESQEHEFPRSRSDESGVDAYFGRLDTDNVPYDIKYATCEQALALLDGWDVNKEIEGISTTSTWIGGARTILDRSVVPMNLKAGICAKAWNHLTPYLRDPREITVSRV